MEITFEGKRALVTGGAEGIGKRIAERLAAGGAKVFVLDKNETDLATLKEQLPEIETVHADLRHCTDAEDKISKCLPIDLLVNNAGVAIRKGMLDVKPDDVDLLFEVNYKASFFTAQVILRDLIERKREGSIVNISSCRGSIPECKFTTYSNSKAALMSMTKSLALECGPYKIRVNCVSPFCVNTAMNRGLGLDFGNPKIVEIIEKLVPLHTLVTTDDIANSVLFLLSEKASKITGADLPVDCGLSIGGSCQLVD